MISHFVAINVTPNYVTLCHLLGGTLYKGVSNHK